MLLRLTLFLLLSLMASSALPFALPRIECLRNGDEECGSTGGFMRSLFDNEVDNAPSDATTSPLFPTFCGRRPVMKNQPLNARIVGGEEAKHGQFPWQAQILVTKPGKGDKLFFLCGGTLVNDEMIVTAAHCFKNKDITTYTVILGKHKADPTPACDEQRFKMRRYLIHPKFDSRQLIYDVALVWLTTEYNQTARFTDYILPACLPSYEDNSLYDRGDEGVASGWGLTDEGDSSSAAQTLQFVQVPMIHSERCIQAYRKLVTIRPEIQFCAGNDKGQDACAGDSGGPFVKEVNGKVVLIGVVSFGKGCARKEFPGVYVRVQAFLTWMIHEAEEDYKQQKKLSLQVEQADDSSFTFTTTPSTTTASTTTAAPTTTTASPTTTTALPDGASTVGARKMGPVCKGRYRYMSCPSGTRIKVRLARYGKKLSSSSCGSGRSFRGRSAGDCWVSGISEKFKSHCNGKTGCWVYHSLLSSFTDPCPQLEKYIEVFFDCEGDM